MKQLQEKYLGRRNEIRLESYKDEESLELVKKSNLETYGNELGPTADSLYEKYGSWLTVIEKACSTNAGMDACLGLYDEYYYTYGIKEENEATEEETSTKVYTILEGANQSIAQGKELTFRFDIDYDTFKTYGEIWIDEMRIEEDNYTSKSGSTIITFKDEFTKTLAEGSHHIEVPLAQGRLGIAKTDFTIEKADSISTDKTVNKTTDTTQKANTSNPNTGDNIAIWISLMVIAMIGVAGTVKFVKRNK